jgi:hypothetical protein
MLCSLKGRKNLKVFIIVDPFQVEHLVDEVMNDDDIVKDVNPIEGKTGGRHGRW